MILPGKVDLTHIMLYVGRPLGQLLIWDIVVTAAWLYLPHTLRMPEFPLPLLASIGLILLAFRNSVAFARWQEARQLWGRMNNLSRSFARQVRTLLPAEDDLLQRELVCRQIAFTNTLAACLRRRPALPAMSTYLDWPETTALMEYANIPQAILLETARRIVQHARIDSQKLHLLETTLKDITDTQGSLERIRSTPLPIQYASYPSYLTRLFCLILPLGLVAEMGWFTPLGSTFASFLLLALLQIGDDLQDPFSDTENDIPIDAITRGIEIDLLDMSGQAHGLRALEPENGILW